MANVKITQLPLATTPLTGTEVFPLVQGTTTKQVAITGLFTSPVMTNPTLGTVGQADLINATGLPISTGVAGLGTGVATFLGTPSSANLRAAVTDETGSGALVFANAPVLVAPDLGTPSVLVATNATGTAVGLTAGSAITNANLTGAVTSVGNATSLGSFTSAQLRTALTDETGAGSAVFATSPTITAPILNQINDTNNAQILGLSPTTSAVDYLVVKNGIGTGVPLHFYADGSSANIGLHIQPKGTGLVTISDGTDFNKGIRFRSSSSAASAITLLDAVSTAGRVVTLPDATTTLVGRDTTDTLTNKTIAFSSNTFSGTLAIANGGTGQATANAALNALLPAQTGNASKYLQTDGTNSSWDAISLSTADITGTLGTANGGTGLGGATPFTSGGVVYASSTSALATGSGLVFDGTNVGVGTTINATRRVNILSGAGITPLAAVGPNGYLLIDNTGGGENYYSASSAQIWVRSGTEQMRLTSTGLGIGTSSPSAKLDVNGNIKASGGFIQILSNYKVYLNDSGNTDFGNISNNGTGSNVTFDTNGAERMRIANGGNVGIGTSSPSVKLEVAGAGKFTAGNVQIAPSTATNNAVFIATNTGGTFFAGLDSSTAASFGVGNYSAVVYNGANTPMVFFTNATERARIPAAGGFQSKTTISVGDATPSTSGAGITFPATQSASSDANTLDDYEEGTWTPSYTLGTGSVSGVTSSGSYVKIGKQVTLNFILTIPTATAATLVGITGFPFTVAGTSERSTGASRENSNTGAMWQLTASSGGTSGVFYKYDNTSVITSGATFVGSITYFV